jgi:hypothetical protein
LAICAIKTHLLHIYAKLGSTAQPQSPPFTRGLPVPERR